MMLTIGAICFGIVVGWITYRTLRRTKTNGLSDIASVIGAVGGAAVMKLFPSDSNSFGAYCLGLFMGFFAYLIIASIISKRATRNSGARRIDHFLGEEPDENQ